ncbi:Histone-lysine N-methyltransferase SETMAR [Acromyrmex echinatior]|uniref:Histone-lysine N-methyltransferase SETMAR n=1 Tax=Acromyrmex echinatior TaxID=103372 RepID=F4WPX6_ACREC|nr:Histone-lysine N-methyltransferase SETMAR [Acromyrmex echinatior]
MKRKKILFLQDNAPAHKSITTMAKINDLRLQLLPHPPYSPDLAPSDYYLFPNLKRWLINKKFNSREEIIDAAEEYFADLSENYFSDGIKKLENRWHKCIDLKGDYIE